MTAPCVGDVDTPHLGETIILLWTPSLATIAQGTSINIVLDSALPRKTPSATAAGQSFTTVNMTNQSSYDDARCCDIN